MAEDRILTPEEVAERLAISPLTAVRWMRSGRLPGGKLGGKIWRMKESALEAVIAEQQTRPGLRVLFVPLGATDQGHEAFPLAKITEVLRDHGWVMTRPTGGSDVSADCCPICAGSAERVGVFECRPVTYGEGGD